jgi:hypothetical protein
MDPRVADYAFLWDGSDPGWTVQYWHFHTAVLIVRFPRPADARIVAALRLRLPELRARTARDVLAELRGTTRYVVDASLYEARRLAERFDDSGFTLELGRDGYVRRVLYNRLEDRALRIEDDALAALVCACAVERGLEEVEVEVD